MKKTSCSGIFVELKGIDSQGFSVKLPAMI